MFALSRYNKGAVLGAALLAFSLSAAQNGVFTESLTANPQAAVSADWKPINLLGKDYWLMLLPEWRNLKGVSHEKFVREASIWGIKAKIKKTNNRALRTGLIREIELFDVNKKNVSKKTVFTIVPQTEDTVVSGVEKLNDGDKKSFAVITADHRNNKTRFQKVKGIIRSSGKNKISHLTIYHGNRAEGNLQDFSVTTCDGKKIPLLKEFYNQTMYAVRFKTPVAPDKFIVHFATVPYKLQIGEFPQKLSEELKRTPFTVASIARINENDLLGLGKENMDQKSFKKFLDTYKNSFLGFSISEFDANYGQMRRTNNPYLRMLDGFAPAVDRNREDAVKYMRNLWDLQRELFFDNTFAMSGGIMGSPYFAEWGARTLLLEYSCRTDRSARILMMFVKSAGKQYKLPWGFYMAYYAGLGNPNSLHKGPGGTGLDFGQSASHGTRALLLNYYMGSNLQWLESQPWGQVKKAGKDKYELTANGKALKTFYDWISSKEGKRGICYSPMLFLLDYHHGQTGRPDWKVWYHLPMEDGDYMIKHFFNAVSPLHPRAKFTAPEHCINLANSPVGDLFDVYFANAPSGVAAVEEMGKFAAVILTGDIRFTLQLVKNIKEYVKLGGTVVVNSGHAKAFDKAFLGLEVEKSSFTSQNMKVAAVKLNTARPIFTDEKARPLITKNNYGKGSVIFTAPYFMLENNKKSRSPLITKLLKKIQSEVMPFQVSGDVQFLVNKMDKDNWKLILMNNRGVSKPPLSSFQKIHHEFDSKVTVTVPAGAVVRELYAKAKVEKNGNQYTLTVPAGDFRVLSINNVKFGKPLICAKEYQRKVIKRSWKDLCKSKKLADIPVKDKKIIAEWEFSEGQGNVVIDSVTGAKIKLHNGVKFVKIPKGYALKFDGKRTWGLGKLPPVDHNKMQEFSVEMWVKPNVSPGSAWTVRNKKRSGIVLHHGNMTFAMGIENKKWHHQTSYNGFVWANTLPVKDGVWTHLAASWNKHIIRFYVDGKEVVPPFGVFKISGVHKSRLIPVFLGTHYSNPGNGTSRVFNGLIGELRYFNYALSEQDIKEKVVSGKKKYQQK